MEKLEAFGVHYKHVGFFLGGTQGSGNLTIPVQSDRVGGLALELGNYHSPDKTGHVRQICQPKEINPSPVLLLDWLNPAVNGFAALAIGHHQNRDFSLRVVAGLGLTKLIDQMEGYGSVGRDIGSINSRQSQKAHNQSDQ